ncbi:hypothetical protein E4U35_008378, partial [Claviceps purpurea]
MLVLSNFATGDRKQGRDNPFRCFKDEKSLVSYFQRMKKLLVFFSRVAYREGGHFTVRAETDAETVSPTSERQEYPQLPQDIIRPTDDQRSMEPQKYVLWGIGRRWGLKELKPAVGDFFMQLICHEFNASLSSR